MTLPARPFAGRPDYLRMTRGRRASLDYSRFASPYVSPVLPKKEFGGPRFEPGFLGHFSYFKVYTITG